ncbi:SCO6745 family protein [Frankia sp. AgKG'84/4]
MGDGRQADGSALGATFANDARRIWEVAEPIHAVIAFHPGVSRFAAEAGCHGYWMGYIGMRSAPLGSASAATITSAFYNFAPRRIARSVPDVWAYSTPARLLDTRLAAMDAILRELWGMDATGSAVRRAAELAGRVVAAAVTAGRPLAAANAALPIPAEPHLALWQALTTLREHRGDGHIVALVRSEVDPCEALVLAAATGRSPAEQLRLSRGWSDREWAAATRRLANRGWLSIGGELTALGAQARAEIENVTDLMAAAPFRQLSLGERDELYDTLYGLAERVALGGGYAWPNPVGLDWPPASERAAARLRQPAELGSTDG